MKNILPLFAAFTLFAGVACSTYTSTTDPNDKGSGTALSEEVTITAPEAESHTAAPATESHAPAAAPTTEAAAHSEKAAH